MKRLTLFLALMIGTMLLLAISPAYAGEVPSRRPDLPGDTKIRFGQTKAFPDSGVSLTFEDVVEDSRCPVGAVCPHDGAVEISLLVEYEAKIEPHSVRLRLPAPNRQILQNGKVVSLSAVYPHPVLGSTIPLDDYFATIAVTPRIAWE